MNKEIGQAYEHKRDTYFSNLRRDVLPFIPPTCKTLLDVGCGAGGFGSLIKQERGAEVWGVDISAKAIEQAQAQLDYALHAPLDDKLAIPDRYFDVITFNDSLEHFPSPYSPLELCKRKLAPNGVVVCSIPNVRYIENVYHFLVEMDWQYQDSGILDETHLRFFTKKSMLRMFEIANFQVLSINGVKPHYWSGKKIFLLRLFFDKWMQDMKYLNYVVVARPRVDGQSASAI